MTLATPIMRSVDFYSFREKLNQEVFARDFIFLVLKWLEAEPNDIRAARSLTSEKAIDLSKQFFPIFIMEHMEPQNTTRH